MLDSRVLETAIGLATTFLLVSLTASSVTESIARWTRQRARRLEPVLRELFKELAPNASSFTSVALSKAAEKAAPKTRKIQLPLTEVKRLGGEPIVSYVSPEAFVKTVKGAGSQQDATAIRAIFDDSMAQLQAAYKRWATTVLFLVGLAIAVAANISAIDVAKQLWTEETARQLVIARVDGIEQSDLATFVTNQRKACGDEAPGAALGESLPMGWHCSPFEQLGEQTPFANAGTLAGWLMTALMAMLGAQFWFDLLGRFVNLRPGRPPGDTKPIAAT